MLLFEGVYQYGRDSPLREKVVKTTSEFKFHIVYKWKNWTTYKIEVVSIPYWSCTQVRCFAPINFSENRHYLKNNLKFQSPFLLIELSERKWWTYVNL